MRPDGGAHRRAQRDREARRSAVDASSKNRSTSSRWCSEVAGEMREADDRGVELKAPRRRVGRAADGDLVRLHARARRLLRAVLREQADRTVVVADCRLTRGGRTRAAARSSIAPDDRGRRPRLARRTRRRSTRSAAGSGLALPIARRVIERHGGRVWSPPSRKASRRRRAPIVVAISCPAASRSGVPEPSLTARRARTLPHVSCRSKHARARSDASPSAPADTGRSSSDVLRTGRARLRGPS